jgi:hypothetical protein
MPQKRLKDYLIEVVTTENEIRFISAISNPKIGELSTIDTKDRLIDILAKWRWMSGVNTTNQDENEIAHEMALICKFIINNYPNITLDEISLSIDLSLTNKLECDVRTFNVFSPMYVSRILNAYIEYKNGTFNDLMRKKHDLEEKRNKDKEPTDKEKMDSMIETIEHFYDKFKNGEEIEDYFNILYNYFRKKNIINPDKNTINEAMAHGLEKSKTHVKTYFDDFLRGKRVSDDYFQKRYARNYCVKKLFEIKSIDELISEVKITDFQNV